jgi:hypothetical protein
MATRGPVDAAATPAPEDVVIDGLVRGKPVRLRVTPPSGDLDVRSLADELMRAMNRVD